MCGSNMLKKASTYLVEVFLRSPSIRLKDCIHHPDGICRKGELTLHAACHNSSAGSEQGETKIDVDDVLLTIGISSKRKLIACLGLWKATKFTK